MPISGKPEIGLVGFFNFNGGASPATPDAVRDRNCKIFHKL